MGARRCCPSAEAVVLPVQSLQQGEASAVRDSTVAGVPLTCCRVVALLPQGGAEDGWWFRGVQKIKTTSLLFSVLSDFFPLASGGQLLCSCVPGEASAEENEMGNGNSVFGETVHEA